MKTGNPTRLTLVTAFYDLAELESRPPDRNAASYFTWAEMLFALDVDMVFYLGNDGHARNVDRRRRVHGLAHRTQINVVPYEQLVSSALRNEVRSNLEKNPISNATPKDTANYLALTWQKVFLVERAMLEDPFGATHFGWIDFGIGHVVEHSTLPGPLCRVFANESDRVRVMKLRSVHATERQCPRRYASQFRHLVAGGLFTGSRAAMFRFCHAFLGTLNGFLAEQLPVHEEAVIAWMMCDSPGAFDVYYGDYKHLLVNHERLRVLSPLTWHSIAHDRSCGEFVSAYQTLKYIDHQTGVPSSACRLTGEERFRLHDELFIASFHADPERTTDYVERWINELEHDVEQRQQLAINAERIRCNLSFLQNRRAVDRWIARIDAMV